MLHLQFSESDQALIFGGRDPDGIFELFIGEIEFAKQVDMSPRHGGMAGDGRE